MISERFNTVLMAVMLAVIVWAAILVSQGMSLQASSLAGDAVIAELQNAGQARILQGIFFVLLGMLLAMVTMPSRVMTMMNEKKSKKK